MAREPGLMGFGARLGGVALNVRGVIGMSYRLQHGQLRQAWRTACLLSESFAAETKGSVALIFGLAMLVLCGFVAFSVDFSRAMAVRNRLQSAVDAAVLGANPLGTNTAPQIAQAVTNTFAFNMPGEYGDVHLLVDPPIAVTDGYRVTAHADVPTYFAPLIGIKMIKVNASAEAIRAQRNVEVALVLDNTYSMNGQRIADLQTAAKQLIDQIVSGSTPGSVKFALVPFSNYVNVGMQYRSVQWMPVPADYTTSGQVCSCTQYSVQSGTCYNDGVAYSCSWGVCNANSPQSCSNQSWSHTWNGCAGSRTPAPDLTVSASFSSPIPGILDIGCPSALTRLTTDPTSIKSQIDAMVAQGETYIPSGLMWGWRVLDPGQPFADGAAYGQGPNSTKKIMILMTDGYNTRSQGGGLATDHEGTNASAADQAMTQLCSAVKATGIELYTIDYQVNNANAQSLLQACATNNSHYFNAQDSAGLQAAFNSIAGTLIKLALSK